jgi:hypothetical protein
MGVKKFYLGVFIYLVDLSRFEHSSVRVWCFRVFRKCPFFLTKNTLHVENKIAARVWRCKIG